MSFQRLSNHPTFEYYITVDFEATTDQYVSDEFTHEIIEFPVVLINAQTLQIEDGLQIYIKPTINPTLSKFCTELTGITQEQVDNGVLLEDALLQVHQWLQAKKLIPQGYPLSHYYRSGYYPWFKFLFVTDGTSDFLTFLRKECYAKKISMPCYYKAFCDAKQVFQQTFNIPRKMPIKIMLETIGLEFQGKEHSGIWDAYNLAVICIYLMNMGVTLGISRKQDPPNSSVFYPSSIEQSSNNYYSNSRPVSPVFKPRVAKREAVKTNV